VTAVVEVERSVAELLGAGVVSGAAVCVAVSSDLVPGWLVVEETAPAGEERRCAVVRFGGCSVVAAGLVSEVKVVGEPVPTEAEMPAWAPALAGAFWGAQRARAERDEARRALAAEQARWGRILVAANEFADGKGYCEDYDQFLEAQGLPGRDRKFVAEVAVTLRVLMSVSGCGAEVAAGTVDVQKIAEVLELMDTRSLFLAIEEHEVTDTTEEA
jgi:hypothetical protein